MKENHILIGLGGTGGKVLKAFRKRLYQEYNDDERAKLPIAFLYVDSSTEEMMPGDKTCMSWERMRSSLLMSLSTLRALTSNLSWLIQRTIQA